MKITVVRTKAIDEPEWRAKPIFVVLEFLTAWAIIDLSSSKYIFGFGGCHSAWKKSL